MHRFYVGKIGLTVGNTYQLKSDVANHIKVLRLRVDDKIIVFMGDGYDYEAVIAALDRNSVSILVVGVRDGYRSNAATLELYLSVIASDKMDFAVQKSVELGVSQIVPMITQYTQNIKSDKIANKIAHWNRIIISSAEQSTVSVLPTLSEIVPITEVSECTDGLTIMLLTPDDLNGYSNADIPIKMLEDVTGQLMRIRLLVGPEGGFSQDEISKIMTLGGYALLLGNYGDDRYTGLVLRSETAVVAGISAIKTRFNIW